MNAGKGDKPRNCFSEQYRNNYDDINWQKNPSAKELIEIEKRIDKAFDDISKVLKELGD